MTTNESLMEFFATVRNMRKTDHVAIPCTNGCTIKVQKGLRAPTMKLFYFEPNAMEPSQVCETTFSTMKTVLMERLI